MALDYDYVNIKNWKTVCYRKDRYGKKHMTPLGHLMPWACLFLDMNGVTEKNVDEWMRRLALYKLAGCTIGHHSRTDEFWPTREEVQSMIGLRTNVSTLPPTKFNKKMFEKLEERAKTTYPKTQLTVTVVDDIDEEEDA